MTNEITVNCTHPEYGYRVPCECGNACKCKIECDKLKIQAPHVVPKAPMPTPLTLRDVSDRAFRFLAGLNLQDHPVKEQREGLEVVRTLKEALRPSGGTAGPSTLAELERAATLFNQKFQNTGWSVRVWGGVTLELVYEKSGKQPEVKKEGLSWDQIQHLSGKR